MYVLKCLNFLLLFSHFPQSTIKKGFHSLSRLPSVTESDENVNDSYVDMNQSGRHSNAEDSQVIIFLTFLTWPSFIFQRVVKDKIQNTSYLNIGF